MNDNGKNCQAENDQAYNVQGVAFIGADCGGFAQQKPFDETFFFDF
jgi:hypothetical protein